MKNKTGESRYTIEDLCELTGLSRRTIRYYVHEGLLEPPSGRGRGGFYYDSHLQNLRQIKSLQEKGMSLSAIAAMLVKKPSEAVPVERDVWVRFEIAPGVELCVRRDVEVREPKKVRQIVQVIRSMAKEEEDDGYNSGRSDHEE